MPRPRFRPFLWLAWALVLVGLVLPVGAMFVRSCIVYEVVMDDGTVLRAAGEVHDTDDGVTFDLQSAPGEEKQPASVEAEDLREVRTVFGLDHYERVFGESRTLGLLEHSALIALGGALLALLLGLPVAFLLARTNLPGRRLIAALCFGPAILPPFFIALGGARALQAAVIAVFGLAGGDLQIVTSILVFGCVLFPLAVLLVAPALAAVPAGPWEAARLLGGPRAAFRRVVVPAVLPAVLGTFVLAFLMALTDFAVPDVLGFMLPAGGAPTHVFATEILLQWKQNGNAARAVATGAPYLVLTTLLLLVALLLLRRSPAVAGGRPGRARPRIALARRGRAGAFVFLALLLGAALVLPLGGIATWAGSGAEGTAGGSASPSAKPATQAALFDFSGTLDRTTGSREERDRWLSTGLAAALLAMFIAVPLARLATRGGRLARTCVVVAGALPLAVPGLVLSVGTLLFWQVVPGGWVTAFEESIARPALVLAVRFLPFALVGAWLVLRRIRPGHEEAAATLGASRPLRTVRIVGPLAFSGILTGALLVLVLALRELDSIILIDTRILPMRLYDKIHFNRMGDEANLLFLCLAYLLVPALIAAGLLALRARRSGARRDAP
jgi:iron(III) transport system permease protein